VLHLKRFQYTTIYRDKITSQVEFPLTDMDFGIILGTNKSSIYDLYAVSNHIGGMSGGHYTAFALNRTDQNWYKLDDSKCSITDASHVISPSAYLLFYRLRTSTQPEWPEQILDDDEEEEKIQKEKEKEKDIDKEKEQKQHSSPGNSDFTKMHRSPEHNDWRKHEHEHEHEHLMEDRMDSGHECEFGGYEADYEGPGLLPPLPDVPGHRRNHHGSNFPPQYGGNYTRGGGGEGRGNQLARSSYVCSICNDFLQGLEELQIHLLTTHHDDPNARSLLEF